MSTIEQLYSSAEKLSASPKDSITSLASEYEIILSGVKGDSQCKRLASQFVARKVGESDETIPRAPFLHGILFIRRKENSLPNLGFTKSFPNSVPKCAWNYRFPTRRCEASIGEEYSLGRILRVDARLLAAGEDLIFILRARIRHVFGKINPKFNFNLPSNHTRSLALIHYSPFLQVNIAYKSVFDLQPKLSCKIIFRIIFGTIFT
jgi:hypothetical protein